MNDIIAWPGYTDAQQGAHVNAAATFDYAGAQHGSPMIVRYTYGAGQVLLSTTHFEYRG